MGVNIYGFCLNFQGTFTGSTRPLSRLILVPRPKLRGPSIFQSENSKIQNGQTVLATKAVFGMSTLQVNLFPTPTSNKKIWRNLNFIEFFQNSKKMAKNCSSDIFKYFRLQNGIP